MLSPTSASRVHAATRSTPGIVSQRATAATAPVFVGRYPPGVRRARQFRVPQTAFDPVNAEAKSDDGNGSFLLEQVLIAESSRADDPGQGRRGAPDHLHRR